MAAHSEGFHRDLGWRTWLVRVVVVVVRLHCFSLKAASDCPSHVHRDPMRHVIQYCSTRPPPGWGVATARRCSRPIPSHHARVSPQSNPDTLAQPAPSSQPCPRSLIEPDTTTKICNTNLHKGQIAVNPSPSASATTQRAPQHAYTRLVPQ